MTGKQSLLQPRSEGHWGVCEAGCVGEKEWEEVGTPWQHNVQTVASKLFSPGRETSGPPTKVCPRL